MLSKYGSKKLRVVLALLVFSLVLLFAIMLPMAGAADVDQGLTDSVSTANNEDIASHRLIVQLESPALAELKNIGRMPNGRLDVNSFAAQTHIARLEAEQARFVSAMRTALPSASVATYICDIYK